MASEKNDSLTSPSVKTVAVKRRIVEPKDEPKKEINLPKKSKLAVRITGRALKADVKENEEPVKHREAEEKPEKKIKKSKSADNDIFHKTSHHIVDAEKTANHAKAGKKKAKNESRPIGLYRKIFVFFVILTLALLAAAFYFFFVTLTIEVSPKTERISDKLSVVVYGASQKPEGANFSGKEAVGGSIEQIPIKESRVYPATGAEILGQEIIGKVKIINNYNQGKTLVATTRLLSPEGKLFRIKNQVEIPAGGSREVDIYSDEPSQDMAIGPTEFTIPGLWAGLQDKIYAKSDKAFVYQTEVRKFVQAIDIEKAIQDLKETLAKKVSDQFGGNYKGFDKVIAEINKDSLHSTSSAVAKQNVNEFTVAITAQVDVIAFKGADLEKLAKDKFASVVASDKKLVELEKNKIDFNLVSADFVAGTATLEVPIVGAVSLSNTSNILKKEKLVGLTSAQITNYLQGLDAFSDIKLIFSPPFITKAPSLVDRIKIVIK